MSLTLNFTGNAQMMYNSVINAPSSLDLNKRKQLIDGMLETMTNKGANPVSLSMTATACKQALPKNMYAEIKSVIDSFYQI